ncbi:MAG: zinc-binding alcohol dehydrogenase [Candidatus Omnitrophica bacterium]|nr:zinc-binding alcohol dehydrogenase [Candidatus Omnitrophota bacterium]
MPHELCWLSAQEIGFHPVGDMSLSPHQIRVRTHLTRLRHGVDLSPCGGASERDCPQALQAWGVADVLEAGAAVKRFAPGDRVFGPMRHADRQVLEERSLFPMSSFSNRHEFSTFIDAGMTALHCIHLSRLRFGDRIAVWGLGVVGLMAMQYALASGAREIIAVDPIESRRKIAQNLGAHLMAPEWPQDHACIDAAVVCSDSPNALRQATHSLQPESALVVASSKLYFDEVSSLERIIREKNLQHCAARDEAPPPDLYDRVQYSIITKRVVVWPIISHYVPFEQAPAVCPQICQNPSEYIQVLFTYGGLARA